MSEEIRSAWELIKAGRYEKAIEIETQLYDKSRDPIYLRSRGSIYLAMGDYTSALEDFKLVTTLEEPRFLADNDYILQGVCYWYLNQPSQAVGTWKRSLTAPYTDAAGGVTRSALLLYAAERLQDGELRKEALGLLRKHWQNHQRRVKRKEKRREAGGDRPTYHDFVYQGLFGWPGAIVPFLLGKIDVTALEQQVMTAGHEILRGRWQCQADFYSALRALREGNKTGFRVGMIRCANSFYGYHEYEYYLARWEVERGFPEVAFA